MALADKTAAGKRIMELYKDDAEMCTDLLSSLLNLDAAKFSEFRDMWVITLGSPVEKLFLEKNLPGRSASAAGLDVESTTGSGSAAGLGVGSAAGAGPPACKLRLRQDSQNQDLFFFEPMDTISAAAAASPGMSSGFFLDPNGRLTKGLLDWLLCSVENLHRKGKPIRPLFINGQVKTGKSYMLNEVLPAVVNTYCSGSSGQQHVGVVLPEPNFLRVTCLTWDRNNGNGGFLRSFLIRLKWSAAKQQLFAAANTPIPSDCDAVSMLGAIQDFMQCLPQDRLNFLLIDEVQSFFLMRRPMSDNSQQRSSTLAVDLLLQMRCILKELLLESPYWVAWAITGSSMTTLWANVAATPTNGFALIYQHDRLNLEPKVEMDVLNVAWEQLKAQATTRDRALPDDLVWRSPPQVAMLAYLCNEWMRNRTISTAAELVEMTMQGKLIPEVLADLRIVLQELGQPRQQLLLLHELVDPMAGVEPAKLPMAFGALLASFATMREGRLFLDNPLFAQVLQAITTESGELVDSIADVQLISSKMVRELVLLGECCKDSNFFNKDLHSLLEDMTSALALPPDVLLKADWFVHVLDHRCNRGSKIKFEQNYRAQARQDAKVGLSRFHHLLRNVLCHGSLSEQQKALELYPPKLAEFHSRGRISEVMTKVHTSPMPATYDKPMPRCSTAPGTSAAATPTVHLQPHARFHCTWASSGGVPPSFSSVTWDGCKWSLPPVRPSECGPVGQTMHKPSINAAVGEYRLLYNTGSGGIGRLGLSPPSKQACGQAHGRSHPPCCHPPFSALLVPVVAPVVLGQQVPGAASAPEDAGALSFAGGGAAAAAARGLWWLQPVACGSWEQVVWQSLRRCAARLW
ncbi:hypothetical protein Vafri_18688 [Volvox africanus]|uniref:Uncharacterized protein n=1 Tax=Volvox africanus TaxID=51714 RepID=A0A8J4BNK5_9CHLO|nr:hypothetical protein Vafri_18688 [Volvox africanus]